MQVIDEPMELCNDDRLWKLDTSNNTTKAGSEMEGMNGHMIMNEIRHGGSNF